MMRVLPAGLFPPVRTLKDINGFISSVSPFGTKLLHDKYMISVDENSSEKNVKTEKIPTNSKKKKRNFAEDCSYLYSLANQ